MVEARKNGSLGGYRMTAGKGKMGWYKGIYCNSSWELAWVVYSLEHGKIFSRNHEGFIYEYKDKIHKYYPDFLMSDSTYVEIKGYNSDKWIAKKEQFQYPLVVLGKEEMKMYLDYVVQKYGKNFIDLYE